MPKPIKHENNGACTKCVMIKLRYPLFYAPLWEWFRRLQLSYPEIHISCAGRDEHEQEQLFLRKATRAHFGKSAHNYNAALDLFFLTPGSSEIYPKEKFEQVVAKNLPIWIEWYGRPGSSFYELPHVEIKDWRDLVKDGHLKLIGGEA